MPAMGRGMVCLSGSVIGRHTLPVTIVDTPSKHTLNVYLKDIFHILSCQRLLSVRLGVNIRYEVRVKNNKMTVDISGPFVIAERYGNGLC